MKFILAANNLKHEYSMEMKYATYIFNTCTMTQHGFMIIILTY